MSARCVMVLGTTSCGDTLTHRALEQVFDRRIAVHQLVGQWLALPRI